jgi:hypothetical protein
MRDLRILPRTTMRAASSCVSSYKDSGFRVKPGMTKQRQMSYAMYGIFSSPKTFKIYCKMPILIQTDVVSKEMKKADERRIYTQNN